MSYGSEHRFSKEEINMARKYLKRYSLSLTLREMQMKTSLFLPRLEQPKSRTPILMSGVANWYSHYGNQHGQFFKSFGEIHPFCEYL